MEVMFYVNTNGQTVTHGSYSARSTFKKCPEEFRLTRIEGWSQKEDRAAPIFGKCIESGVEEHELQNRKPGTAVTKFVEKWGEVQQLKNFKELKYTDTEGDWAQLLVAGTDLMRLYEIKRPRLPISTTPKALFQQVSRKEFFPDTQYAGLWNKAILDILSFPRWNHPMLAPIPEIVAFEEANKRAAAAGEPPIPYTVPEGPRPLIIDVKTAGADLDTLLVRLDPQLGEYAWQERIPDIAFLWFVKKSPELKSGGRVTLLQTVGPHDAGYELVVLLVRDGVVYLGDYALFNEYKAATRDIRGKALDAAKDAFFTRLSVLTCEPAAVTKQRLQFAAVRLTETEMDEIGRSVAQTTVEQVRAHNEKFYPKLPGIRFPNQKCNFCAMRYICLNDPDGRDANLTRKGEEWLDGVDAEQD